MQVVMWWIRFKVRKRCINCILGFRMSKWQLGVLSVIHKFFARKGLILCSEKDLILCMEMANLYG